MDEERFKAKLNPEQYRIMREGGAEMPYVTKYWDHYDSGIYFCAACGARLFSSLAKFNAGEGWPTFRNPANAQAIETGKGSAVFCRKCKSHLGELAGEGSERYYRINSACLDFEEVGIEFEEKEKGEDREEDKTSEGHSESPAEEVSRKSASWGVSIVPVILGGVVGLVAGVGVGVVWCDRSEIRFEGTTAPSAPAATLPDAAGSPVTETPLNVPTASPLAPKVAPVSTENAGAVASPGTSSAKDPVMQEGTASASTAPAAEDSSGAVEPQGAIPAADTPLDTGVR